MAGQGPRVAGLEPREVGLEPRKAGLEPRVAGLEPRVAGLGPGVAGLMPRVAGLGSRRFDPEVTGWAPNDVCDSQRREAECPDLARNPVRIDRRCSKPLTSR
ncbi:hypothetical protein ACLKA7_000027 [Drosophila subpalustris]